MALGVVQHVILFPADRDDLPETKAEMIFRRPTARRRVDLRHIVSEIQYLPRAENLHFSENHFCLSTFYGESLLPTD